MGVRAGHHRDEYVFTTDTNLVPTAVIGYCCGRWNIETTFQEARSGLGLEAPAGGARTPSRAPAHACWGCIRSSRILFHTLPVSKRTRAVARLGKATVTFSDALAAVRRWLWGEALLPQAGNGAGLKELPEPIRELLLATLAPAT